MNSQAGSSQTARSLDINNLDTVIFDYGNTLIEFSTPQVTACDRAIGKVLMQHYGSVNMEQLKQIRDEDRLAPYLGSPPAHKENNMPEISRNLIKKLYHVTPTPEVLDEILEARLTSFVTAVEIENYIDGFLARMGKHYQLGLLSNYPDGHAIRQTLVRTNIANHFQAVVVSGDVGRVKPHPLPFRTILEKLGTTAERTLMVGDNWFGDIQGAKRLNMCAAFIHQWHTLEHFDPEPGDHQPDVTLNHILDLEKWLLQDSGPQELSTHIETT